jgi:TP901 family phage tail tape measure protein
VSGKSFPLSLIIKATDVATATIRKVGANAAAVAKRVTALGTALSVGVTGPLAAMGGLSIAAFSRFEAGMASVSTLVDTSVESMEAMNREVLAIGKRAPVPLKDLTDGLASARGAGVSAAEQFKVLEGSARLGVAALGSTAEAVDIATSSINAWGLKGKEAEGVYNTVFQAVNFGKMTLSQLAQGFGGVAGTVASAGVKLDEYLASVAALTTTGLPAAEAHTQLRAVISGLTRTTKESSAVFQKLGAKDLKDLIAKSGGLVPALDRIKVILKSNDASMLRLLGSTEALNAVLGLTGNQAGAFRGALDTMRSGADGVNGAFEKQNRTAAATTQRLQNTLEGIAISVGRVLVPVLEQLAPLLEQLADRWEALGTDGQTSIIALAVGAAALGPTITVLGNMAAAFGLVSRAVVFAGGWGKYLWMMRASIMSGLIPSITAAAASVWGFTAALLANPITWIVAGIVLLAGAAYLIYKNWEPIKAWFQKTWATIWEAIGPTVLRIWELFKDWTPLGRIIKHWGPISTFFKGLWDSLVPMFETAWEKIKPIVDALTTVSMAPLRALMAGGRFLFGSGEDATAPAERVSPTPLVMRQSSEARVQVDFANLPPGARVTPAAGNTAPLDLNYGYSMVTP